MAEDTPTTGSITPFVVPPGRFCFFCHTPPVVVEGAKPKRIVWMVPVGSKSWRRDRRKAYYKGAVRISKQWVVTHAQDQGWEIIHW